MYTQREPYLATPGTGSCWQTWHNTTVQRLHQRQTRSHGAEGWKDASEDNKWMIVQCATFPKRLNPSNIDNSISDIHIRFPFESSLWISLSGCKLTILPDVQPSNRIVIISDLMLTSVWYGVGESPLTKNCLRRFIWQYILPFLKVSARSRAYLE